MTERTPGSADRVRRAYDRLAGRYDARWRRYVDASVREVLVRSTPLPGARILDVGCGTGILLNALEQRDPGARLAGVDVSRGMLARARARLASGTTLVQADGFRLPFGPGTFGGAVSTSALHFHPRPQRILEELRRVVTPGGEVVLVDWCRDHPATFVADLWLRVADPAHARTLSRAELEGILAASGFREVRVERFTAPPLWGMMVARAIRA